MIVIEGEQYLEAEEAAERLGVKPETLYAYVSRGRLRSFRRRVGRGRLYLVRDVERLLALLPGRVRPRVAQEPQLAGEPPGAGRTELPQADRWAAER